MNVQVITRLLFDRQPRIRCHAGSNARSVKQSVIPGRAGKIMPGVRC
jgi:hypothetical protein